MPGKALVGQAANPSPTVATPDLAPSAPPARPEVAERCSSRMRPSASSSPASLLTSGLLTAPFFRVVPLAPEHCPRLLTVLPLGLPFLSWLLFPSPTRPAGCDPRPPFAYTERGSSALPPPAVTTPQVLNICLWLSTELSGYTLKVTGRLDFIHSPLHTHTNHFHSPALPLHAEVIIE